MQGKLLEPERQRREEQAGAAEERAERAAGVQAGQPLKQAEQEPVSGKTGSHALQGFTATHVHITEARRDQKDSQCFILQLLHCGTYFGCRMAGVHWWFHQSG
jgi:hypothetical protein